MSNMNILLKSLAGFALALALFIVINLMVYPLYPTHQAQDFRPGFIITSTKDTTEQTAEASEEPVDFATLIAQANPEDGASIFKKKCRACHKIDSNNAVGPYLNGVSKRATATADGFSYSAAMLEKGGNWDSESLNAFLESPKTIVPGTKMTFAGLNKEEERAALIRYLETLQ